MRPWLNIKMKRLASGLVKALKKWYTALLEHLKSASSQTKGLQLSACSLIDKMANTSLDVPTFITQNLPKNCLQSALDYTVLFNPNSLSIVTGQ